MNDVCINVGKKIDKLLLYNNCKCEESWQFSVSVRAMFQLFR